MKESHSVNHILINYARKKFKSFWQPWPWILRMNVIFHFVKNTGLKITFILPTCFFRIFPLKYCKINLILKHWYKKLYTNPSDQIHYKLGKFDLAWQNIQTNQNQSKLKLWENFFINFEKRYGPILASCSHCYVLKLFITFDIVRENIHICTW